MNRWRAVPLALRVGLILQILLAAGYAFGVMVVGEHLGADSLASWVRVQLAVRGGYFVAHALLLFGALELSHLLVGRAARGAKLAASAWGILIVADIAVVALRLDPDWDLSLLASYVSWGWFVITALVGVGFALAASKRLIIVVLVGAAWLILQRPPVLLEWLEHTFAHSPRPLECMFSGIDIAAALMLAALALVAVADVRQGFIMPVPQRAREGLGWVARSLWFRLAGVLVIPLVMLMLSGNGHEDPRLMMAKAAVVAGFISIASLIVFGFGALDVARSHHAEVRRWPFLIAAIASLWSAGVMMTQLPDAYRAAIEHPSGYYHRSVDVYVTSLTLVVPLVTIGSAIAIALAISGFAKRRGNFELARRGQNSAILVGTLQLGALVVANILMPAAPSPVGLGLVILGGVVAGIVALVNVARLAGDGRALVDDVRSALPVAQVV